MENLPLPEHLPRNPKVQDASTVSSAILSRMADTSSAALTAELASSWVVELDKTLEETKVRLRHMVKWGLVLNICPGQNI